MDSKEINSYIKLLKRGEIERNDLPKYVRQDEEFKAAERKAKLRKTDKRGFDIIRNTFFVSELLKDGDDYWNSDTLYFNSFDEYYNFLSGKIYTNSCYYQCYFDDETIKKYNLDLSKLKNTSFINYQIDETYTPDESYDFDMVEKDKKLFLKWLEKFEACENADGFLDLRTKLEKSKCSIKSLEIIVSLLFAKQPEKTFSIIMDLINHDHIYYWVVEELCLRFGGQRVLETLDLSFIRYKNTRYKRKKDIKAIADKVTANNFNISVQKGFSKINHFYYINTYYYDKNNKYDYLCKREYFETFEEFAGFLSNDLSDCDLSEINFDIDDSKFVCNENTELPAASDEIIYIVEKECVNSNSYSVHQEWTNVNGKVLSEKDEYFEFFFDFAFYLGNDLSGTDFVMCDGIENIKDISDFNLTGCKFKSNFLEKFGMIYTTLPALKTDSFKIPQVNEEKTELILQQKNEIILNLDERRKYNKVCYITDLHLVHAFINHNCRTVEDRGYVLKKTASALSKYNGILLVGGDVSSNFTYYKQLLTEMNGDYEDWFHLDEEDETNNKEFVFFTLGNHELWDFEGQSFSKIVKTYRKELDEHHYHLLQNNIFYETLDRKIAEIDEETLTTISIEDLRNTLRKAQLVIFGGLGFSGFNNEFNADNGIYRQTITRQEEIRQSKAFNSLYEKVCQAAFDKNVIIFTHTSKPDWSGNEDYKENFIYVNGHTHRNYFYDDGQVRVYADNQIGYKKKQPFLKYFYIDKEIDYFADYKDGIYEITKEEYNDFYSGKNIGIDCNRDGVIYMVKRNNYYCFFKPSKSGLCILNGGALKKVENTDINYYYNNMLSLVSAIKVPLDKYTSLQQKISDQVKAIGGKGRIHGCIVDIDFYNHIYVNPIDQTITGYYAYDMISKEAYRNIPSLLKAKCPVLYSNYKKMLSGKSENALVVSGNTKLDVTPVFYPDTDIYKASREIRKMQKLNSGILTTWTDLGNNLIEG